MKSFEERFYFTRHRDCPIYIADYSYLPDAASAIEAMQYSLSLVRKEPPKSVYAYADYTGVYYEMTLLNEIRKMLPEFDPYIAAQCLIGLGPRQRLAYNSIAKMFGYPTRAIATPEQGLMYLAHQYRDDREQREPRMRTI